MLEKNLDREKILRFYSKREIQEAIIFGSEDREIATRFYDTFGKRPDTMRYPSEILEAAKQGATSFHASEERWTNPMLLVPGTSKKDLDSLRKGWDLVIDIDCNFLDYSKIAADLIIKALKQFGIYSVSCKFSGRAGFHIGVCFESFPDNVLGKKIKDWFPEGPRAVALLLKDMIKDKLAQALLSFEDIDKMIKRTNKPFQDLIKNNELDPYTLLGIDTVLISSRHLFRTQYSVNEKSGWVSVPINPDKVLDFNIEIVQLDTVKISQYNFLDRSKAVKNEASNLLITAFDHAVKEEVNIKSKNEVEEKDYEELTESIPEEFFPNCIKKGLEGMKDGKKRFLFILLNFLVSVGWDYERIEKRVLEWNEKNSKDAEALRENYIVGQIRYHKYANKKVLPPNCANSDYYKDLGLYCDNINHDRYKNPVTVAIVNWKRHKRDKEKEIADNEKAEMKQARKNKREAKKEDE